jgi:putative methionine-R-sulfoxide reductase with GAF domain
MVRSSKRFFLLFVIGSSWLLFAVTYLVIAVAKKFLYSPEHRPTILAQLAISTCALFVAIVAFVIIARGVRNLLYSKRPPSSLLSFLRTHLYHMQKVQLLHLHAGASEGVGKIMEAYKASNAALYFYNERQLQLVKFVALNDPEAPAVLDLAQSSITTHVASSKSGYCSVDVKTEKRYLDTDRRTQSEIAVPVKFGDRLLGVLNLESNRTHNFVAEQIPNLEKKALRLAPLLLLKESYDRDRSTALPLTLRGTDWGLSSILAPLCMEACSYFERLVHKSPSCTIWEYEPEKQCFHARVAIGFDYEYRRAKTLPKYGSFTGEVFDKESGFVFMEDFTNIRSFVRRDKAAVMGLTTVASTPIVFPVSGLRYGVLSFYFFDRIVGIDAKDVREFSDFVASIIERFNNTTPDVVQSYVAGLLVNSTRPSHAKLDLLRELTQDILKSEYCSIFVSDPTRRVLRCASTNGLMRGNRLIDIHRESANYDLDQARAGFTVAVAKSPGRVLRKNESQDEHEVVIEGKVLMPSNTLVEAFSTGDLDHRRIMAASIGEQGKLLGVIRVNRSGLRAPYIKSDEATLHAIGMAATDLFENAVNNPGALVPGGAKAHSGSGGIVKTIASLLEYLPNQTTTVEGFLQEVFSRLLSDDEELRGKDLHMLLRRVITFEGEDALVTIHTLSTRAKELKIGTWENGVFNPASDPCPVKRSEGGIAWACITAARPVSFETDAATNLFKPIHEFARDVKSGINLPFAVWNFETFQQDYWVLCLDFELVCENVREYIRVLQLIIRKLEQLLTIDSKPRKFFLKENLEQFADRLTRALPDYERVETIFNSTGGKLVTYLHKKPPENTMTKPDLRTKEVELVYASMKVGRISLIGIPKELLCRSMNTVFDCWSTSGISNPTANSHWVFDLSCPFDEMGLRYWPNEARWNGPETGSGGN